VPLQNGMVWQDGGSKFAGKLYCVCMVEIIMLIADSPSHFLAVGTDLGGSPSPQAQKKKFNSLIFNKKFRLGPPYFVAWAPSKIINHQLSPCKS